MATDGPTPPACVPDVYQNGTVMFVTHTIPSNAMEGWVKNVVEDSGQQVDWHFFGGRAVIKALGNLEAVQVSMRKLMPDHDDRFKQACGPDYSDYPPPRPDWW